MRDGNQQKVSELLRFIFTDPRHHTKIYEARLRLDWPEIVGPMIAKYTEKLYLNGPTLTIYVTSASLRNELSYAREQLAQRLNEALGSQVIKNVRLR